MVSDTRWTLTAYTPTWVLPDLFVRVTSDRPCHLWLRWTDVDPRVHLHAKDDRGLLVLEDPKYCFVRHNDIEQLEEGDTLDHHFIFPGWQICVTKYFHFWGTINGVTSPSNTAIFQEHCGTTSVPVGTIQPDPLAEAIFDMNSVIAPWAPARGPGDIVVCAYQRYSGPDRGIYLAVFRIYPSGIIENVKTTQISVSPYGSPGNIVDMGNYTYAMPFLSNTPGQGTYILTFTLDALGTINIRELNKIAGPVTNQLYRPYLAKVSDWFYLLGYTDTTLDTLKLSTINISEDGIIDPHPYYTLNLQRNSRWPHITQRYELVYAVTYSDRFTNGRLISLSIHPLMDFMYIIEERVFDPSHAEFPRHHRIWGSTHPVIYQGLNLTGRMATFRVLGNGDIRPEPPDFPLDTWEWESIYCAQPYSIEVSDNWAGNATVLAVVYGRPGPAMTLRTFQVAHDGIIAKETISQTILDMAVNHPSIIHVSGNVYATFYALGTGWGKCRTWNIMTQS